MEKLNVETVRDLDFSEMSRVMVYALPDGSGLAWGSSVRTLVTRFATQVAIYNEMNVYVKHGDIHVPSVSEIAEYHHVSEFAARDAVDVIEEHIQRVMG